MDERHLQDLARTIERLPEADKLVFSLVAYEELSFEEAAAALDIPTADVAESFNRAIEALQPLLDVEPKDALYPAFRENALSYFKRHGIEWWGGSGKPTTSPLSSQIACINHLEPARLDENAALSVAQAIDKRAEAVLPIEDGGWVAYEWVGTRSYLGERGWSSGTRGKNITSIDALMAAAGEDGIVRLLVIEWKFTERYPVGRSLSVSAKGTSRVATYRPLLETDDCPIIQGDHDRLFYDPFYQLMRQTLLAQQMVAHHEFGASDWIHVHVIPESNTALRATITSPSLTGANMGDAWRSTLKEPDRYKLMTPTEVVTDLRSNEWSEWRAWLRDRYGT